MAESVANRRYSHNSRKRSAQVGDIAPAAVRHSFVRTPYVCRPFRVVFLCAAFVVLKEIQIRFSLARLPPFLPPRVHPSHRNPLSRRRSILVTSSIEEEEGGSGGRKEGRGNCLSGTSLQSGNNSDGNDRASGRATMVVQYRNGISVCPCDVSFLFECGANVVHLAVVPRAETIVREMQLSIWKRVVCTMLGPRGNTTLPLARITARSATPRVYALLSNILISRLAHKRRTGDDFDL